MRQVYGRGRNRKVPGVMGRLEQKYADHLEALRTTGAILEWAYEPEKFRLADKTFYTPDFRVLTLDGAIEFHEVKGFWEDQARIKIKVAAELHPYRFLAVTAGKKAEGGGWNVEHFS